MTRIDNVAFPAQWGKPALAPAPYRALVSVWGYGTNASVAITERRVNGAERFA